MNHDHAHDVGTPALYGMGCLWSLGHAIYAGLPPWELVPPILFGAAALLRALQARTPRPPKPPPRPFVPTVKAA